MSSNEFYEKWKRKTKLETSAIVSLEKTKKIILKNIPKTELISIYLKGSFIRREMKKHSDVDFIVIVKKKVIII